MHNILCVDIKQHFVLIKGTVTARSRIIKTGNVPEEVLNETGRREVLLVLDNESSCISTDEKKERRTERDISERMK